jgi:hypothetical protein
MVTPGVAALAAAAVTAAAATTAAAAAAAAVSARGVAAGAAVVGAAVCVRWRGEACAGRERARAAFLTECVRVAWRVRV